MDDSADASISNDGRPEAQFGAELRLARERADLSLRALARILHRAHSSLVEYERGHRLAPVDVVREYESALGLKPDALVALRDEAHAQRCALGRDGELPDRTDPVPRPSDPTSTSPRSRPRLRPLGLAVSVAVAAVLVVVGYGLADRGDKTKPGVGSAPTQPTASADVTIDTPARGEVQRCTEWSGTASLPTGHALVLGVKNLDNAGPKTYFSIVDHWSRGPGQGHWSRRLYFGTVSGQDYAVSAMVVAQSAVDAVPDKNDPETWSAEGLPPTAEVVKTVHVKRRAGAGHCFARR